MLGNLKIGVRLGASFGIVIALLGGIVLVAERSLASLNQATTHIVDDRYPQVVRATELLVTVNENAIAMRNILLADNPAIVQAETAAIKAGEQRITVALAALEKRLSSDAGRKAHQEIMALRAKYLAGQQKFMDMASTGGTLDATALLMESLRNDQQAYTKRIQGFLDGGGKLMEKSGRDAAALYGEKRMHIMMLALAACVAAVACGVLVTRSITGPLRDAVRVARAVASGDLCRETSSGTQRRDETGQLLQALHDMNGSLRNIVAEVRSGADAIAGAAAEIAQGNMDLSQRTERQAGSLEETASAMEQLSATVANNADQARGARERARHASTIAGGSNQVVEQVAHTMEAISDSSRRIADITGVIDSIAFQTNILALNAAVEAARAGEQGRGFAVVASEVRTLAQRSAAAARDIKSLIDTSAASVASGSKLAQQAGASMHDVVHSVSDVADCVRDIAAASAEQSSGLSQVNAAVAMMDQATQQNAALVEQAAAAAQTLQESAAGLVQLVSVFRLEPQPGYHAAAALSATVAPAEKRLPRLAA
ncbi:HAMP domain-containing protein [Duganella sp. FT92W]|uniref:HAMP domain-containing protein n=1 Tax=Pseudoduganella rivuli TaxID=2666085 RepID=A0A7X2ISS0_9BURK|nr:methyl-accepting chemotaxis protein [Pseudoduganella rivuli]MRV75369.1 HAMP domain-containing protein [Pseudoduganella rivuli]